MTNQFENQNVDDLNNYEESEIDENIENEDNLENISDEELSLIAPLSHSLSNNETWAYRGGFALNESQKEFNMLKIYLESGSGRSYNYLQLLYKISPSTIKKIADRNNWAQRIADYDRHILAQRLASEKTERQQEHKRKLEDYRQQQEFLGRHLTSNAAKIAAMSARVLDSYLENDREIDLRDVPSLMSTAAKIAEVGKNLQGSALGVDELLTALEEADMEE